MSNGASLGANHPWSGCIASAGADLAVKTARFGFDLPRYRPPLSEQKLARLERNIDVSTQPEDRGESIGQM